MCELKAGLLSFVSVQCAGVTVNLFLSDERQTRGVKHKVCSGRRRVISSEPPGEAFFDVSGSYLFKRTHEHHFRLPALVCKMNVIQHSMKAEQTQVQSYEPHISVSAFHFL